MKIRIRKNSKSKSRSKSRTLRALTPTLNPGLNPLHNLNLLIFRNLALVVLTDAAYSRTLI